MLRIAIVEDELDDLNALQGMLGKYGEKHKENFKIGVFNNPINFLNNYQANYDLIFMDVQMPYMDGMTAAAKLREIDGETMLIFITNMAKLAVKGYEVSAFDFIVKPLDYELFAMKMERIVGNLSKKQDDKIIILSEGTRAVITVSSILYVEVLDHQLIYHTINGDYRTYGTIKKVNKQLEGKGFFQSNKCYLVNLDYVQRVVKNTVTVNDVELQISHPRRKAFMEALNSFIGG